MNTAQSPDEQASNAHIANADASVTAAPRRNRLVSILSVLWKPARSFREFADGNSFVFALLAIFAIDVLLTVMSMPKLISEMDKQMLAAPASVEGMRGTIMTVAVVMVAILNTILLAFTALLLTLSAKMFRAKAGFAAIFSGLLLASVPTALGRLLLGAITASSE
jgi:hypothetical protein